MLYLKFIVPSILGVLAHHLLFIHGEWHLQAPVVLCSHIFLAILVINLEIFSQEAGLKNLSYAFLPVLCYLLFLFGSITIYRLYFHRLRSFPGPRFAAITKLWHVWQCRDSRNHLVLEKLYQKYGPVVRTGPNEITLFTPSAFEAMDGPQSNTTRSDWYDLLYPRVSSVFTRDKTLHNDRRRIWSHSLNTRALASYEPRIMRKVISLSNYISKTSGEPILVNDLMRWFSFDLMGAFAFSEDFGMMEKLEYHSAIRMVRSAITLLGPFSPAIWLPRLAFAFIPGLWKVKDWFSMLKFCDICMERRMKREVEEKDIASWFIEEIEKDQGNKEHRKWLSGDTATVVVAGSDTTAPSLTAIFYYLAQNPQHTEIIYQELSKIDVYDIQTVTSLPHLNGSINEAMRLLPAVLTFVTRVTPPEGLNIDGIFIPGNVKLAAPRYTIGRLNSAWKDPQKFCPERWYSKPEMIKDKRAFAPFGLGRTSCVGKNLALTELRMVTAILLSTFTISFCPGDNGEAVERDLRDQLTANPGDLYLIFKQR